MADLIKVRGMVISSTPVGENDKRVVLLTKEKGKICAFARGARRPGNHLMASSDSMAFGTFYLIYGRDSYTLANADITSYFRELTGDVSKIYSAYYFLELAEYYSVENQDGSQILNLLYVSFNALLNPHIGIKLVRYIYEMKMLVINGEYPNFFECADCGREDELKWFSISKGGMICSKCAGNEGGLVEISQSALYTLQFIVCTPLNRLYTFTVNEDTLLIMKMVAARCMHEYVDKKMNSLDILDALT